MMEESQIFSPNLRGGLNSLHIPTDLTSVPVLQSSEFHINQRSDSTVQKLRRELQLLLTELKDRDRELNCLSAAHHQQIQAWEHTRERELKLEQRCARLDDELQKRNNVIRVLTSRVVVVENREKEIQKQLSETQHQLKELLQKEFNLSKKCQDFEEQNKSLNSTVLVLSAQLGSLQVREEQLTSTLKLKDKDVTEASGQLLDMTGRLRDLEMSLSESHSQENKLRRESQKQKQNHREAKCEITQLKEHLQQHISQSSLQREEIIRLKQELQLMSREQAQTAEGDSWKDELLELARSKQERTMSELSFLRKVCENQHNDIQLLQLSLESARQSLRERASREIQRSPDHCDCVKCRSPKLKPSGNKEITDCRPLSTILTNDFDPLCNVS